MFMMIVLILLMIMLIIASGAALHLGVFKAHRHETRFIKKALGGVVSYAFSAVVWLGMYSHHYMGW